MLSGSTGRWIEDDLCVAGDASRLSATELRRNCPSFRESTGAAEPFGRRHPIGGSARCQMPFLLSFAKAAITFAVATS